MSEATRCDRGSAVDRAAAGAVEADFERKGARNAQDRDGMMTTLNGRLDDPGAWVTGIPDDLYAELDRLYESFDTILVGRTTCAEMAEYWPGAETDGGRLGDQPQHGPQDEQLQEVRVHRLERAAGSSGPTSSSCRSTATRHRGVRRGAEGAAGRRHPPVRRRAARADAHPPGPRRPLPPPRPSGRVGRARAGSTRSRRSASSSCRARPPIRTAWSASTTSPGRAEPGRMGRRSGSRGQVLSAYGTRVHLRRDLRPREGSRRGLHRPAAGPGPLPRRDRARLLRARDLPRPRPRARHRADHLLRRLRDAAGLLVRRRALPGRPVRDGLAVRDGDRDRARARAGHRLLRDGRGGGADAGGRRHRRDGRRAPARSASRSRQDLARVDAAAVADRVRGVRRDDRVVAVRRRRSRRG